MTPGARRPHRASLPLRKPHPETSDGGDELSPRSRSKAQPDVRIAEFVRRQSLEVTRVLSSSNTFAITGPRGRLGFRRGEDRKSSDLVHENNALVLPKAERNISRKGAKTQRKTAGEI